MPNNQKNPNQNNTPASVNRAGEDYKENKYGKAAPSGTAGANANPGQRSSLDQGNKHGQGQPARVNPERETGNQNPGIEIDKQTDRGSRQETSRTTIENQ